MSKAEEKLYLGGFPEITSSERKAITDIIGQINAVSLIQVNPDNIEAVAYNWSYDEYKVFSKENNDEYTLKISFGDSRAITKEYNILKHLSSTESVPYAMSVHPVKYFSEDGFATLTRRIKGPTLFDLGIHEMMSHNDAVYELFSKLGKIYATDISKIHQVPRESTLADRIGRLEKTFGEDIPGKFSNIFKVSKYEEELEDMRIELTAKASQYNIDCIVNGNLNPFCISGFPGDDVNAPGVYINDWTQCFIGNPLYDFYNFILENGLFEEKPRLEQIFFYAMEENIPEKAEKMEEIFFEYVNYFQVFQFWKCVEEYVALSIEDKIGGNSSLRAMLLKQKFESIRSGLFKISPNFERMFSDFCAVCDKIGEQKQKKEENDD
jgi:hypothetical protein